MLGILAVLLMQGAAPAPKPSPSAARPSVSTAPDWARKPNADDLAELYPKAAVDAHIEGRATIHCMVTAAGELAGCKVLAEEPVGSGFGDAALALAAKFKMKPQTRDGTPVDGGQINIPISFKLPRTAAPPKADVAMRCYGYAAAEAERNPSSDQAQAGAFAFGAVVQMYLLRESAKPSEVAEVLASQRKLAASKLDDPSLSSERAECAVVLPAGDLSTFRQLLATLPR